MQTNQERIERERAERAAVMDRTCRDVRVAALEEAAKVCAEIADNARQADPYGAALADRCAAAIRALKERHGT